MTSTATLAESSLQSGLLLGIVLIAQVVLTRHLHVETIPGVLRGRVALSNRLRPWLFVAALTMAVPGLILQLS